MKGMILRLTTAVVCALVIATLPAISSATVLSSLKGGYDISDAAKLHRSTIIPQRR
jgi:hypothetical protein